MNTFTTIFPEMIDEYKFVKEIVNKNSTYGIAEYTDGQHNCICKIWSGKRKNKLFYQLKNEYLIYKNLSLSTIRKKMISKKFPNIKIPKLVVKFETKKTYGILIEEINAKEISNKPLTKKLEIYHEILKYFNYLNLIYKDSLKEKISNIGFLKFYFGYITTSLLAIIKHPKLTISIMKNLKTLFSTELIIKIKKEKTQLIHRDLGDMNILSDKNNNIYVFDFQLSAYSFKNLEIATIYYNFFSDKKNNQKLNNFIKKILCDQKNFNERKIMLNFPIIYDLAFGHEKTEPFAKKYLLNTNYITKI